MTENTTGPASVKPAQQGATEPGESGLAGGAKRLGRVRRSLTEGLDEAGRRRVDTLFDILLRKAEALAKQFPDGLPEDLEQRLERERRKP